MEAVETSVVTNLSRLFKRFTPKMLGQFIQGYIQLTFDLNDRKPALDASIQVIISDLNLKSHGDSSAPLDAAEAAYYLTSSFSMMQFKLASILPRRLRALAPIYKAVIEVGTEKQLNVERVEKLLKQKATLIEHANTTLTEACGKEREVLELLKKLSYEIITSDRRVKKASTAVTNATAIYNDAIRQLEQLSRHDYSELPHLAELRQKIDSRIGELDSRIEPLQKSIAESDYQLDRLKEFAKIRFELSRYCPRLNSIAADDSVAVDAADQASPVVYGRGRSVAFDGSGELPGLDDDSGDERAAEFKPT